MDSEVLEAKGLLLGHRNDIAENFIKKMFFEKQIFLID